MEVTLLVLMKKHLDKRCCCTIGHLVVHESMMGMVLQYSTLDVSRWTRAFHEITFDEEGWLDVKSTGKSSFFMIQMRTVKFRRTTKYDYAVMVESPISTFRFLVR